MKRITPAPPHTTQLLMVSELVDYSERVNATKSEETTHPVRVVTTKLKGREVDQSTR
jgi:hypothetical protein